MKKYYFLFSVLVQMFILTSLVTASPLLVMPVTEGGSLPWGNLMTWVLFILFPLNFLIIRKQRKVHPVPLQFFRVCVLLALVMGLGWLLMIYLTAGNWAGNFSSATASGKKIWDVYTYLTPILPFAGYFGMRVLSIFFKG